MASTRSSNLKRHKRSQSGRSKKKQFPCLHDGCGRAFKRASDLRSHGRAHSDERLFPCPYDGCGEAFKRPGQLRIHRRTHSGVKPFPCSDGGCKKKFKSSGELASHHRSVHSGKKPHICLYPNCGSSFAQSSNLISHIRRAHTGEKNHQCPTCVKAFNDLTKLKDHIRTHTGERPHICETCGKGFAQTSNLRTHTRTHIEKLRKCRNCDDTPLDLKEHKCTRVKTKPFKCPCGTGSTTRSNFLKHERVCPLNKDHRGHASASGKPRRHIKSHPRQNPSGEESTIRRESWYGKLERHLEAWKGRCAFCFIHNLGGAGHSISECLQDDVQAVWDKCAILQEELPKEGYLGCRLCYLPLKICDHWELEDRIKWRESNTKICQFSGIVIPVVATLLVENDVGRISTLFDVVDIRDHLNHTSEGIYQWLRQRWGDTDASWSIQLFYRVSAILNIENHTTGANATTTLRKSNSGEDVANIDPRLWALEGGHRLEGKNEELLAQNPAVSIDALRLHESQTEELEKEVREFCAQHCPGQPITRDIAKQLTIHLCYRNGIADKYWSKHRPGDPSEET
jgi:hypothetical protein